MKRALLLVLVAACGDNELPPADGAGSGSGVITTGLLDFKACRTPPLECATLVVPADYANPDNGATISLPVVRAPARDHAKRIGVLTFNFGGPGEATLEPLANDYPFQPIAAAHDLTQEFDFVFMDWRGVDTTTPALTCLTADTTPRLAAQRFAPQSDADWATFFQLVTDVAAGCSANPANAPLLARMDTETAARDFDALRAGLGEDKLNLWGVSYGTRLGAMYSSLFPDHARAIVLDSPVEPAPQFEDNLQAQSESFEVVLQHFFAWCATDAAAASCPFHRAGETATDLSAEFETLLDAADTSPVVSMGVTLDRPTIDQIVTNFQYFPNFEWPRLGKALGALRIGDGAPMATVVASNSIDYANDDNAFSAYEDVILQDMPLPADIATPDGYRAWAETQAPLAPHLGLQNAVAQGFAIAWPTTSPAQHPIGDPTAPPLLITATRTDPATPYPGALAVQAAFANGSYLVTYEGDGHANGENQPCLGDATAAFLLDPTTAPAVTDCPEVIVGTQALRARTPLHHGWKRWR